MIRRYSTILAIFAAVVVGTPASAQDGTQPLDLVRGLRDNGLADLALEYMDKIAKTPNLPPEVAGILPLERAKTRLEQANQETDEIKREAAAKQAKAEFEAFIKANPAHPRLPEARVSLAKVTFLQGRAYMSKAFREASANAEDPASRDLLKAELARARPYFKDSAKAFSDAADELEKLATAEANVVRKKELSRELHQARLDQAIALFNIAETYYKVTGKEVDDRFNAYKEARNQFIRLSNMDITSPPCWIARAWVIECSTIMPEPKEAEAAAKALSDDVKKRPADPAALAGKRMADFFELRAKLDTVGRESTPADFLKVRTLCTTWLANNRTARKTSEYYAVTYYLAGLLLDEAVVRGTNKEGQPIKPLPAQVLPLLRDAEKEFRLLTETENDYTVRANKKRTQAVRMIVGDADKLPKEYTNFEELHMAVLVQLYKANEQKEDKVKIDMHKKAIALLERERELHVPRENAREAQNGQLMLLSLYLEAGRPHQAAIMAEHMARTGRSSTIVAKAGYNAILAYLAAASKIDPTDPNLASIKKSDQDRAAAMAYYLERTVPDDPVTDAARFQLAILLSREGRTVDMFDILHRITPRFILAANARLLQGGAAYEMLRYRAADDKPLIPDNKKADVFRTALTDMNSVLPPAAGVKADEAAIYLRLQLQIAQLHLTNRQDGYPLAEKAATDAKALVSTFTALKEADKKALAMDLTLRAELIRIDSVYGMARLEVEAGKYKEAAERLAPLLADAARDGSLSKVVTADKDLSADPNLPNLAKRVDDSRLDRVVGLALNCRVREGDLAKAGELLALLDTLGGDITRSTAAIYRLVAATKPQIEALRKENKVDEANKLSAGVGALIGQFAGKPNLTPETNYNLGRAFKEIGKYAEAIEQLGKITKPEEPGFTSSPTPATETEEDRANRLKADAVKKEIAALYRGAQLEMIRAYRMDNKFDQAEVLLEAALGKDPEGYVKKLDGPNKNWAFRFVDFRRERFSVLEAKAEETKVAKVGTPLYVEALRGWEKLTKEYQQVITTVPKDLKTQEQKDERKRLVETVLKPRFYEVVFEMQRCRTKALIYDAKGKPPATLTKGMTSMAESLVRMETTTLDLPDDIKAKYIGLMADNPPLLLEYQKAGGVKFLPTAMAVVPK